MNEPIVPPGMPASPPLPPERVQFTMRTFFVAAVWISVGFGGHAAMTIVDGGRPDNFTILWWFFWAWLSLWGIAGILRMHAYRIASVLGTAIMALAGYSYDLLVYLFSPAPEFFGMSFFLWFTAIFSLLWGVYMGLFVGITRTLVRLGKWAIRRVREGWMHRPTMACASPGLQALGIARTMAVAHLVVSLSVVACAAVATLSLPAASAWRAVGNTFYATMLLLDMPFQPFVMLLGERLPCFRELENTDSAGRLLYAFLFFNGLGIPGYYALGWLIGWRLDRLAARRMTKVTQAAEPRESMPDPAITDEKRPEDGSVG